MLYNSPHVSKCRERRKNVRVFENCYADKLGIIYFLYATQTSKKYYYLKTSAQNVPIT